MGARAGGIPGPQRRSQEEKGGADLGSVRAACRGARARQAKEAQHDHEQAIDPRQPPRSSLGQKRLDELRATDLQTLEADLRERSPKT